MAKLWGTIGQKLGDLLDDLTTPDALRERLARGVAALERGDAADAERSFREVIDQEPDNGRAWQLLGVSLLARERVAEAIDALELAAAKRPNNYALRMSLLEAWLLRGDVGAALDWGHQALGAAGSQQEMARVYRVMGEIHLDGSAWDHAVRELRKAAALGDEEDRELAGLLGQALYHAGDAEEARVWLSVAATAVPPSPEVLLLLCRIDLAADRLDEARQAAARLLEAEPGDPEALLLSARCTLQEGASPEQARQAALALLQIAPEHPGAHELLGDIYLAAGDGAGALPHLARGAELDRSLLQRAVALALEQEEAPELEQLTARLLQDDPDSPLGLAARALISADQRPAQARADLERATFRGESAPTLLVRGLLDLSDGRPDEAAARLEAALRLDPTSGRARRALREAQRQRSGLTGEGDLYPRLPALARLLEAHPALSAHAREVTQVREVFDRPLLICVMGEFNSGKSTLVNALIGEEVAAMGVTPTTATINLLKYGERRQARVIWRDDHEELLAWSEVREFLDGLDAARAAEVRQVELLYPSEELLQVNVVDTPGLNSLVEGHEQTAREVLARADAVIWLFSAQQAGKQTEKEALALLDQHRLKTVGVLNKIDRLSDEELEQIMAHLQDGFGDLVDRLLPVSTRQALQGMLGEDNELLTRSRFPALRQHLEQSLFSRSAEVKRRATSLRLARSLQEAVDTLEERLRAMDEAAAATRELGQRLDVLLDRARLEEEVAQLERAHHAMYRRGTEEVLAFVQPRSWALGNHRAAPADRDFLLGMISDELNGLCGASRWRMEHDVEDLKIGLAAALEPLDRAGEPERLAPLRASLDQLLADRVGLLKEQVYTRYTAFARGWLGGGKVDGFFTGKLPRITLDQETVFDALWDDRVDLGAELIEPLHAWQQELKAALKEHLARLELELELCKVELTQRFLDPLARGLASARDYAPR